jgi:hypothetical protein
MQLRKEAAFVLYVGSYLPLGVVLLVQDLEMALLGQPLCRPSGWFAGGCRLPLQHPGWSLGVVAAGLACVLATLATLRSITAPHRIRILEAKHIPADLINYAMPYIVSFMALDFASPSKLLGFAVFFVWIFWITYQSGQIVMNPLLIAFGWKLYEVKYGYLHSDDTLVGRVLSLKDLEPGRVYRRGNLQDVMVVGGLEEGDPNG